MSDRARFQSTLVFEGREQDHGVAAQDHAHAPWRELVALWRGFDLHGQTMWTTSSTSCGISRGAATPAPAA